MRIDVLRGRHLTHLMRLIFLLLLGGVFLTGCAKDKSAKPNPKPKASAAKTEETVTPSRALVGKVARVNTGARFVVLTYPLGQLPAVDQKLNVYRGGAKVGEIKISRERQDNHVVADIVAGDAQAGDEARED